jgi:hypothetical protein
MDANNRLAPPDPGQGGHTQTAPLPVYSLDMNQVSLLFDQALLPRSRRTLLRYCQYDKLDCTKVETMHGEQYFVSETSVDRLVAEILERERFTRPPQADIRPGAPGHAQAGLAGYGIEKPHLGTNSQTTTDPGEASHDDAIAPTPTDERLLKQIEGENDLLRGQINVKDIQIERMNGQIDDLIERGREDKHLLQNFQRKLGMLAAPGEGEGRPGPFIPAEQSTSSIDGTSVDNADPSPSEDML